jgi:hypothetical protein
MRDAYDAGRVHTQRFFKNAGTTGDTYWQDWSYASGQPAYDARIGTALAFNPFVAARNDAIWFPPIPSDQTRHLAKVTMRSSASGTGQVVFNSVIYDLLGVYPLIDGDSTDTQDLDNTLTLPRYADGAGVMAVLVNHVAPQLQAGDGTYTYTGSDNVQYTKPISVLNAGQNKVCSASGTTSIGAIGMATNSPVRGIKSVDAITFTTPPGGLFAIYMVRLLGTVANHDGLAVAEKIATEKCFCRENGMMMPVVHDGAWLGFFYRPNGGARSATLFGDLTFVWG